MVEVVAAGRAPVEMSDETVTALHKARAPEADVDAAKGEGSLQYISTPLDGRAPKENDR